VTEDTAGETRGIADIGGHMARAADEYGTPVYVLDAASVLAAAARLEAAFPEPWTRLYSLKANDLPEVAGLLHARGWGANVVSSGEWDQARLAGVTNAAVSFEGIGKTDADLERVVRETAQGRPPRWLALESTAEAHRLAALADAAGLGRDARPRLDVLLRLNPEVRPETLPGLAVGARSSKFGMDEAEILALVRADLGSRDTAGLRLRGVHVHVGSNLGDVTAWADAGTRAVALLQTIARVTPGADTVDFGGGFPLHDPDGPTPEMFRKALEASLAAEGLALPARRAVEPGRYLVGAAGWLVSRVLHSRARADYDQQVVLDAGMTELIRPALYGSHHPVHALRPDGSAQAGAPLRDTAVEGPVCESTDSFGRHWLPDLRRGDLVAIGDAGAYGASFTSRYNGRPQPAELLAWPDGSLQQGHRAPVERAGRAERVTHERPHAEQSVVLDPA
jgi:diaminopimelate decarboxylase